MKIADVLRTIANSMDQRAQGAATDPRLMNRADLQDVDINDGQEAVVIDVDQEEQAPDDLYLPPLQMKLELLKKAVGVENVYDDGGPTEQEQEQEEKLAPEEEDEIARMKRYAGINPGVMQELSNDEVLDD